MLEESGLEGASQGRWGCQRRKVHQGDRLKVRLDNSRKARTLEIGAVTILYFTTAGGNPCASRFLAAEELAGG